MGRKEQELLKSLMESGLFDELRSQIIGLLHKEKEFESLRSNSLSAAAFNCQLVQKNLRELIFKVIRENEKKLKIETILRKHINTSATQTGAQSQSQSAIVSAVRNEKCPPFVNAVKPKQSVTKYRKAPRKAGIPATNSRDPILQQINGLNPKSDMREWKDLLGTRVDIFWPMDSEYYSGAIQNINSALCEKNGKSVYIEYDDGEMEWVNLNKENWRLSTSDQHSTNASSAVGSAANSATLTSTNKRRRKRVSGVKRQLSATDPNTPEKKQRSFPSKRRRVQKGIATTAAASTATAVAASTTATTTAVPITAQPPKKTNMNPPSTTMTVATNVVTANPVISGANSKPKMKRKRMKPVMTVKKSENESIRNESKTTDASASVSSFVGKAEDIVDTHVGARHPQLTRNEFWDGIVVEHRIRNSLAEFLVQFDNDRGKCWIKGDDIQMHRTLLNSDKGKVGDTVEAHDNGSWFAGEISAISQSAESEKAIFKIIFPQFADDRDSAPWMYFSGSAIRLIPS